MAATKFVCRALAVLLAAATYSCQAPEQSGTTAPDTTQETDAPTGWLSEMIREMEQQEVANPPAQVYRYTYAGQEVYYLTSRCCDIPSQVYDLDGNLLCEPDGGITGKGDGRCPDFLEARTNETLIWEDKREQ